MNNSCILTNTAEYVSLKKQVQSAFNSNKFTITDSLLSMCIHKYYENNSTITNSEQTYPTEEDIFKILFPVNRYSRIINGNSKLNNQEFISNNHRFGSGFSVTEYLDSIQINTGQNIGSPYIGNHSSLSVEETIEIFAAMGINDFLTYRDHNDNKIKCTTPVKGWGFKENNIIPNNYDLTTDSLLNKNINSVHAKLPAQDALITMYDQKIDVSGLTIEEAYKNYILPTFLQKENILKGEQMSSIKQNKLFSYYLSLWSLWASNDSNKKLLNTLRKYANGKVLICNNTNPLTPLVNDARALDNLITYNTGFIIRQNDSNSVESTNPFMLLENALQKRQSIQNVYLSTGLNNITAWMLEWVASYKKASPEKWKKVKQIISEYKDLSTISFDSVIQSKYIGKLVDTNYLNTKDVKEITADIQAIYVLTEISKELFDNLGRSLEPARDSKYKDSLSFLQYWCTEFWGNIKDDFELESGINMQKISLAQFVKLPIRYFLSSLDSTDMDLLHIPVENSILPNTKTFDFQDGFKIDTPFILNDQQQAALLSIDNWVKKFDNPSLQGPSYNMLTLEGYAGTGKTSLMEILAKKWKLQNKTEGQHKRNVIFCATTNSAVGTLSSKVSQFTENPVITVHKLLEIALQLDLTTDELDESKTTQINKTDLERIRGGIIIIDEASMITPELFNQLKEATEKVNIKIIFLGDPFQLPPVIDEKDSENLKTTHKLSNINDPDIIYKTPVFFPSDPNHRIITLTKVERTGNNAILATATNIRNNPSDIHNYSIKSSFNKNGEGIAFYPTVGMVNDKNTDWYKYISTFLSGVLQNPNYFKILATTNERVAYFNKMAREYLGYTSNIPQVGETILGYSNKHKLTHTQLEDEQAAFEKFNTQRKKNGLPEIPKVSRSYALVNSVQYKITKSTAKEWKVSLHYNKNTGSYKVFFNDRSAKNGVYEGFISNIGTLFEQFKPSDYLPKEDISIVLKVNELEYADQYGFVSPNNKIIVMDEEDSDNKTNLDNLIKLRSQLYNYTQKLTEFKNGGKLTQSDNYYKNKDDVGVRLFDVIKDDLDVRESKLNQNGKTVIKKSYDFGYAITIHKSQGATYDNVLIDDNGIEKWGVVNGKDTDKSRFMRDRLRYTAITRARYTVTMIHDLPDATKRGCNFDIDKLIANLRKYEENGVYTLPILNENCAQNQAALRELQNTKNSNKPQTAIEKHEEDIQSSRLINNLTEDESPENFLTAEESKKVLESDKTILSNDELKYWNEQGVGKNPRILVASEHTDPAFHVKEILDVINGKKSVLTWNKKNQFTGHDFAGLYLITKHDGLPMQQILETKIPKLIHFSITGLGNTKYEPGVMKYNDLLDRIQDYIAQGLDPNCVTIRIDPIIPGVTKKEDIENIVRRASEMGIKRIRFSILDLYPSIIDKLKEFNYDLDTYYGKNTSKYYKGEYNFHAKQEHLYAIANYMLKLKDKYGVTISTCAEIMTMDGINKEGCLSVAAVNNMLGTKIEDKGENNNNSRTKCTCFGGKVDALAYENACASHCIYCYAKHGNDNALKYYNEDGTLKDNIYTRTGLNSDNPLNNGYISRNINLFTENNTLWNSIANKYNFNRINVEQNASSLTQEKINILKEQVKNILKSMVNDKMFNIIMTSDFAEIAEKYIKLLSKSQQVLMFRVGDKANYFITLAVTQALNIPTYVYNYKNNTWNTVDTANKLLKVYPHVPLLQNRTALLGNTSITDQNKRNQVVREIERVLRVSSNPKLVREQAMAIKKEYMEINKNESVTLPFNSKTENYYVSIDSNLKNNYKQWQSNNPGGIIAYRVNYNNYNTEAEVLEGHIGNPFSDPKFGESGPTTVAKFYNWLVTGNNYGNEKATESYRQAILQKIVNTISPKILYYKELGRPSHATVIGYLIANKYLIYDKVQDRSIFNRIQYKVSYKTKSELKNALAYTSTSSISVASDLTTQDFFDYIKGNIKSPTSKQKKIVFQKLSDMGYDEILQDLVKTDEDAQKLILYHEFSHAFWGDLWNTNYYKNDLRDTNGQLIKDKINWIAKDKIDIELRATIDAINRLTLEKQQKKSDINSTENTANTNTRQSAITKNILNQLLDHLKKGAKVHFSAEMKEYLKKYGIDNLQRFELNTNPQEQDEYLPFFIFTTSPGEIYGFVTKDGEIYLDETVISPEHPIHEYTHLWDRMVQQQNPELWKRGVELMKKTSMWTTIANDIHYGKLWEQQGITGTELEDRIASEVHARFTGEGGAKLLDQIAKEKGSEGIIAKLKDWIKEFWSTLKATFSNWSKEDLDKLTLKDFNHMTVRDFADGVNFENLSQQEQQSQPTSVLSNLIQPKKNVDLKKATAKASIANKFIGFGAPNSSTELYQKQAGEYANVGNYTKDDTIFVSINGNIKNAIEYQLQTIDEAVKAIRSGARLLTDSAEYLDKSSYNTGEKLLAEHLKQIGAIYKTIKINGEKIGQWTYPTERQTLIKDSIKPEVSNPNILPTTNNTLALGNKPQNMDEESYLLDKAKASLSNQLIAYGDPENQEAAVYKEDLENSNCVNTNKYDINDVVLFKVDNTDELGSYYKSAIEQTLFAISQGATIITNSKSSITSGKNEGEKLLIKQLLKEGVKYSEKDVSIKKDDGTLVTYTVGQWQKERIDLTQKDGNKPESFNENTSQVIKLQKVEGTYRCHLSISTTANTDAIISNINALFTNGIIPINSLIEIDLSKIHDMSNIGSIDDLATVIKTLNKLAKGNKYITLYKNNSQWDRLTTSEQNYLMNRYNITFIPSFTYGTNIEQIVEQDQLQNLYKAGFDNIELRMWSRKAIKILSLNLNNLVSDSTFAKKIFKSHPAANHNYVGKSHEEALRLMGGIEVAKTFLVKNYLCLNYPCIVDNNTASKLKAVYNNFNTFFKFGYESLAAIENIGLSETRGSLHDLIEIEEDGLSQDAITAKTEADVSETFGDTKEHWMASFRTISPHLSVSNQIRSILDTLYDVDEEGKIQLDELGQPKMIEAYDAINKILMWTQGCLSFADKDEYGAYKTTSMIYMLQQQLKGNPWLNILVGKYYSLKTDDSGKRISKLGKPYYGDEVSGILITPTPKYEQIQSLFYSCFRKFYQSYMSQFTYHGNATHKILTEDSYTARSFEQIKRKYETKGIGNFTLWDANAQKWNSTLFEVGTDGENKITRLWHHIDEELKQSIKYNTQINVSNLIQLCRIFDIPVPVESKLSNLINSYSKGFSTQKHPLRLLLNDFANIYNTIEQANNNQQDINIVSSCKRSYEDILNILAPAQEVSINPCIYNNGKLYYAYVQPSYLNKLVYQWGGKNISVAEYKKWLNEEYGKYEGWFTHINSKNGNKEWMNVWLSYMYDDNLDNRFSHSVSLSDNNISYADKTPRQYYSSLIKYFFSQELDTHKTYWAWYRVPLLSNKASEEYIKGPVLSIDTIIDALINKVFNQEVNRIRTVRIRKNMGNKIKSIDNFDKNGDKFLFLDFIQDAWEKNKSGKIDYYKLDQEGNILLDSKGNPVLAQFSELLESYIKGELIADMKSRYSSSVSRSSSFTSIQVFKRMLNSIIETSMEQQFNNFKNTLISEHLLEEVKIGESVEYKLSIPGFKIPNSYNNNVEKALKDYFYNDYFAHINIIQLTMTDLAYYKNATDAQKRAAELHNPSIKPNKEATINGKRVSDGRFRTLFLKDAVVTSDCIKDLEKAKKTILKDRGYSENSIEYKILESSLNNIIDAFKEVNWTDAQAYVSISGYRKRAIMYGNWSQQDEEAYQNLKQGNRDSRIVWQPMKPFGYGQTTIHSGTNIMPELKVGMQCKNSEFVLAQVGIMTKIAGQKDSILTQLYDFMENSYEDDPTKGIDTIQFESAIKTGLMAATDALSIHRESDNQGLLKELEQRAYTKDEVTGKRIYNDTYVRDMDFDDYGIQQNVPAHVQGEQQMGSQLRILAPAGIENTNKDGKDNVLSVKGTKEGKDTVTNMTVADAKKDYFKLVSENLKDSLNELAVEFAIDQKDIRLRNVALSRMLKKQILESSQYGIDMYWACSLNENGEFNVPLDDPIYTNKLQTLINSIITKKMHKQNIAGGPVVQASSFGISRDLKIVFNEDGTVKHFECYVPAYSNDLYSKYPDGKGGIDVSKMSEYERTMIGYRIPTESKYSMIPIRIMGFVPRETGELIIMPKEITTLTGSDFDVDKMYLMRHVTGNQLTIREQRNNKIIDYLYSFITCEASLDQFLKPGGFDNYKQVGYTIAAVDNGISVKDADKMSIKDLKSAMSDKKSLLNVTTHVEYHNQNMVAAKLIGIGAQGNILHAYINNMILEGKKPAINIPTYGGFMLNGKFIGNKETIDRNGNELVEYVEIDPTYSEDGVTRISDIFASLVAATVDAVKDPVLNLMNFNTSTADAGTTLLHLGFGIDTMGWLLSHPAIVRVTKEHLQGEKSLESILRNELKRLSKEIEREGGHNKDLLFTIDGKPINVTTADLKTWHNKKWDNKLSELNNDKFMLQMYYNLYTISKIFKQIMYNTRMNSSTFSPGPFGIDTIINVDKIDDIKESGNVNDDLLDGIQKNPILSKFRQSFTFATDVLSPFYTAASPDFNDALWTLRDELGYMSNEIARKFAIFALNWKLNADGAIFSNDLKVRDYFEFEYPSVFEQKRAAYTKQYGANVFLNCINNVFKQCRNVLYIDKRGLSTEQQHQVSDAFIDVWNKDRDFALSIIEYNYHRGSFSFSPNSFMEFIPDKIKMELPHYKNRLMNKETNPICTLKDNENLIKQFMLHNNLESSKNSESEYIIIRDKSGKLQLATSDLEGVTLIDDHYLPVLGNETMSLEMDGKTDWKDIKSVYKVEESFDPVFGNNVTISRSNTSKNKSALVKFNLFEDMLNEEDKKQAYVQAKLHASIDENMNSDIFAIQKKASTILSEKIHTLSTLPESGITKIKNNNISIETVMQELKKVQIDITQNEIEMILESQSLC